MGMGGRGKGKQKVSGTGVKYGTEETMQIIEGIGEISKEANKQTNKQAETATKNEKIE